MSACPNITVPGEGWALLAWDGSCFFPHYEIGGFDTFSLQLPERRV